MKFFALSLIVISTLGLTACRRHAPADEAAALETVRANVAAMQREDLAGVMATVHSASPQFAVTRRTVQGLFERFDLRYTLSDLQVVAVRNGEIRVAFTQRTERVGGDEAFQDSTVTGVHLLRPDGGKWKIFDTPSLRVVPSRQ